MYNANRAKSPNTEGFYDCLQDSCLADALIVEAKSNGKADWGLERIARQSGVEFALLSIHVVQHPNTTRHFSHVQHQLVLVERELNWRYPFWNH